MSLPATQSLVISTYPLLFPLTLVLLIVNLCFSLPLSAGSLFPSWPIFSVATSFYTVDTHSRLIALSLVVSNTHDHYVQPQYTLCTNLDSVWSVCYYILLALVAGKQRKHGIIRRQPTARVIPFLQAIQTS
jgi:hypothetical protein